MDVSRFFIDRPIFATVLSLMILLGGSLAMFELPIAEYPEISPPTVVVRAQYPGANPSVVADTVAAPLEQSINGVENMLYMSSSATADGTMSLTVTFRVGTDIDSAQVQVQNRVSQALPRLPEEVRRLGVTTIKSSPSILMVVHVYSPDDRYDSVYLRNYAVLQIRDVLARLPGVGDTQVFGSGDYAMRVWLDPNRIASLGLSSADVVAAIREQNTQVAGGIIGAQPTTPDVEQQLLVNVRGRLVSEEEFKNIIIRASRNGDVVRLGDIGRVELGPSQYALRSLLGGREAIALPIYQAPGSNALEVSAAVRAAMSSMGSQFPEGMAWDVVYDPTIFVRKSIDAVIVTLLEAIVLVVLVVVLFLQTWRASVIPLVAVPVSVVGTFGALWLLGYSVNALTLFGLVLAIGIVVDDAIVVVENVERNLRAGLPPREAAYKAMREVSGPIIAIALVLCAVFVPVAFMSGITGQFYRQFAVTIAVSTVISAINSLTLSPALAARLLRPHGAPADRLTRLLDHGLGKFFATFNRRFDQLGDAYGRLVRRLIERPLRPVLLYGALLATTALLFAVVPTGFVPTQDKQYLVAFAQLPDGASLDRTEVVARRMGEIAARQPGVDGTVQFIGLSISGFSTATNGAVIFITLTDFDERADRDLSGPAIASALNREFSAIEEAYIGVFPPPPVDGLGALGGFTLQVQDRSSAGAVSLATAANAVVGATYAPPHNAVIAPGTFTTLQINVPQLFVAIDREKVKQLEVPLAAVHETLQTYLGSAYVNDFNRFGRTYQVIAQADAPFRDRADDVRLLKVTARDGTVVPLGTFVQVEESFGPDRVTRYNGFPAAEIQGSPAFGASSGEAIETMERLADEMLPSGIGYEWTGLTLQERSGAGSSYLVFGICVLLVFLVLAAQYESWSLPFAIVLIVPMCLLSAMSGVWISGLDSLVAEGSALGAVLGFVGFNGLGADNNVFTQIGLVILVGLACKNAILIVEFARALERDGHALIDATIRASQQRLRPILMTSIAFIAGVVPLVTATGAGAEMRNAMGVAVFSGMLGVTGFGLLLTPVFYTLVRRLEIALGRTSDLAGASDA